MSDKKIEVSRVYWKRKHQEACGFILDIAELLDMGGVEGEGFTIDDFQIAIDSFLNKEIKILDWVNAYPIKAFPKPDLSKVAKILKDNGLSLDEVSAHNMRHVLKGIKEILEE